MNEKEENNKLTNALHEVQNSANIQASMNISNLEKRFGPRIDALTESINSASKSSGYLSKVIIAVTIFGTIIATLQWINENNQNVDFVNFSDKRLNCVVSMSKEESKLSSKAIIEYCKRNNK